MKLVSKNGKRIQGEQRLSKERMSLRSKKLFALLLAIVMIVSMLPFSAFAEEPFDNEDVVIVVDDADSQDSEAPMDPEVTDVPDVPEVPEITEDEDTGQAADDEDVLEPGDEEAIDTLYIDPDMPTQIGIESSAFEGIAPLAFGDAFHTVTFKAGVGSSAPDQDFTIADGNSFADEGKAPSNPAANNGWSFAGWAPAFSSSEPITDDVEFTAQWTPVTYTNIFRDPNYSIPGNKNNALIHNYGDFQVEVRIESSGNNLIFHVWVTTNGVRTYQTKTVDNSGTGTTDILFADLNLTITCNIQGNELISLGTAQNTPSYTILYEPGSHGTFTTISYLGRLQGSATPEPDQSLITGDDGWRFVGWSPTPSPTVTGNAIYVAQWTPSSITVTFDANGGVAANPGSKSVTFGQQYGELATTSRQDYVFLGWFTDPDGVTQITDQTIVTNPTDHTLYAHWAAKTRITITAKSDSKPYDGMPLTGQATGYEVSGLPGGYTVENVIISGSITDVGSEDSVIDKSSVVIKDSSGENVTDTFIITTVDGTLTVTKRQVTLTSASDNKTYDGTPLTNGNVTVGGSGFVSGEGATYNVTGTITDPGTADNEFTYTLNSGTFADNYDITTVTGELKITTSLAAIVITVEDNSKMYDRTALVPVDHSVTGLPTGYTLTVTGYTGSIVNVSESGAGLGGIIGYTIIRTADNKDVTGFFSAATVNNGALTITKRSVTLTSASDSKPYDGTALTNNTVTVAGDGFAAGEGATYNVTGTITNPGTEDNKFTYMLNSGTLAGNYEITKTEGKLIITGSIATIEITVKDNSKMYDGTPLVPETHSVTGLPAGYTLTVTGYTGSIVNVSESAPELGGINGYTITRNSDGVDVTNFFNEAKVIKGKLSLSQRKVTLTSATDSKPYDGTPLTNDTVTASGNGFINGEGATYNVTGTITDPGTKKNTFTYTLNNNTLVGNYSIERLCGDLKITTSEAAIEITVANNSKMYDGTALVPVSHNVTGLPTGYTLTVTGYTGSIVNVSESGAGLGGIIGYTITRDSDGEDATEFFADATVNNGALTIIKRSVTLTSADDSKAYDGTPLTNNTVTVTGDGFITGEGATYNVTGTITDPGTEDNEFTYTLNNGTLAGNYTITPVFGELEITTSEAAIVITVQPNSKMYDGTALIPVNRSVTGLPTGYTLTVTAYTGSITNVSESNSNLGGITGYTITRDSDGENVTSFFGEAVVNKGALTVTPRTVTMTSADDSKAYDGTPLTNNTVTVTGDGFITGEGATYNVTGTITDPGMEDNAFTYTLNNGTLESNYIITTVEGTLEITTSIAAIVITVADNSKMYDGTPLVPVNRIVTGLPIGYTLTVKAYTGSITNVSESGSNLGGITGYTITRDSDGEDATSFFDEATVVNGSLTITRRVVTMTSGSDDKPYDGTPLTKDEVTVTGDGFITGEGATYDVTGTITDPGTADNEFTYTLNNGTLESNYIIYPVEGTLEITTSEATIVITVKDNSKMYDGTALIPVARSVTGLPTGYTLTVTAYTGSITNVSESGSNLGGISGYTITRDADGEDATSFFDEAVVNKGALTVNPRMVTMTSGSDDKPYDGTPLTKDEVTVTGDGFVTGEGATYDVTGTITDPGTADNEFTYTLNNGTLANNYSITTVKGTLEITTSEAAIVITVQPNSKMYDGTALVPVNRSVTGLPAGYTLTVTSYTGSIVNVSESGAGLGGITGYTITRDSDGEDATSFFDEATVVNGSLTITRRVVTMTSGSDDKPYDGTPLTKDEVTVTGDGFIEGEGATYNVTGTITDPGTEDNTFEYTLNEGTLADNYIIYPVEGTLEITTSEATIVITVEDNSKMYDGTALVPVNRSVTGLPEGYTLTVTAYTGSITNVSESGSNLGGIAGYTITRDSDGEDATSFFNAATVNNGALTITKRSVTMTSADDDKPYDGTALTNDTVTVTGDGFIEGEGAVYDVTGSITNPGKVDNEFTYTLARGTIAGNYEITTVFGELEITISEAAIVITVSDNEKVYDGTALTPEEFTVDGLPEGYTLTIESFTGSIVNVNESGLDENGLKKGGISGYTITRDSDDEEGDEDVTSFFEEVVIINGDLTITPRPATIRVNNASKVFGQTDPAFTGTVTGLVAEGDLGTVTYYRTNATVQAVGTYPGVLSANYVDNDNYEVTVTPGNFTISTPYTEPEETPFVFTDTTPDPTPVVVSIPDEAPPLAALPDVVAPPVEQPPVVLPEPEIEIFDPDVPLVSLPQTGLSAAHIPLFAFGFGALGLGIILKVKGKGKDEEFAD